MHDELKLESSPAECWHGCDDPSCPYTHEDAPTLPPANTEADVERVAADLCNDQAAREHADQLDAPSFEDSEAHVREYWRIIARSALSLTRPAGGEEVERDPAYDYAVSLLRVLHGKHFPEQAGLKMLPDTLGVLTQIDNLTSALTKPPALPNEGGECLCFSGSEHEPDCPRVVLTKQEPRR